MVVAEINIVDVGSTGKIMFSIAEVARSQSIGVYTYSPFPFSKKYIKRPEEKPFHWHYGSWLERFLSYSLGRFFGLNGINCILGTMKLVKDLKKHHVELIHLHNVHNYCICFPILFSFIKKKHIKVLWTLHDCWTFTGHCPYFEIVKCDKWRTGCHHCPQCNIYPRSVLDSSKIMWKWKKKWFTGVDDMTLVTPSQWLADLTKQSYLQKYPVKVIHNGIDLSIFKPSESEVREKYHIDANKYLILGVAFDWGKRKGLDVFVELSKRLDAETYQIVLVGTDEAADKRLSENIISIHRTQNQQELAELYATANLFVNPTREDTYPTVNMESLACGTPVLTFRTGGSPEILDDTCGSVVECDDVDAMEKEILRICETKPYTKDACLTRAKTFDMNARFREYVDLYREMLS